MRTTKSITISLPPEQLKTAQRMARKQSRTMSELFREGLRRLEQDDEWRPSPAALAQFGRLVELIRKDAKNSGKDTITEAEIDAEVAATRAAARARAKKPGNRLGR